MCGFEAGTPILARPWHTPLAHTLGTHPWHTPLAHTPCLSFAHTHVFVGDAITEPLKVLREE